MFLSMIDEVTRGLCLINRWLGQWLARPLDSCVSAGILNSNPAAMMSSFPGQDVSRRYWRYKHSSIVVGLCIKEVARLVNAFGSFNSRFIGVDKKQATVTTAVDGATSKCCIYN